MSCDTPERVYFQYRSKPKAVAWYDITRQMAESLCDGFGQIQDTYDCDAAEGAQLDIIATIVGTSRAVTRGVVLEVTQFAIEVDADDAQFGDEEAQFSEGSISGDEGLSDEYLRRLIRWKIAVNNSTATIDEILLALSIIMPDSIVRLVDPGDMSLSFEFIDEGPDSIDEEILTSSVVIPKPQGVRYGGYTVVPGESSNSAILTVRTTTDDQIFYLPFVSGFTYNCLVEWGDSSPDDTITVWNDAALNHTYATAGDYDITISGVCQTFRFGKNFTSASQLIDVKQWGKLGFTSMRQMFLDTENCVFTAGPICDTSLVTDVHECFYNCIIGTPDVSGFRFPLVTDFSTFMRFCHEANPDFSNWDVSAGVLFNPFIRNCNKMQGIGIGNFDMRNMKQLGGFLEDTIANTNIENWLVPKMLDAWLIFPASWEYYDEFLINCASQPVKDWVYIDAYSGRTAASDAARTALINNSSWTIP